MKEYFSRNKYNIIAIALVVIVFGTAYVVSTDSGKRLLGIEVNPLASLASESKFRTSTDPVPNQYIVTLESKQAVNPGTEANRLNSKYGGQTKGVINTVFKGYIATMTEDQARAVAEDPNVKMVEQDGYIREAQSPRPQPVQSWGLDRIDQPTLPLNNIYGYSPTLNGSGVTVYVVDGGIRTSHIEFGGRASVGLDLVNINCPVTQTSGGGNSGTGHGTHVAATIGGANYGVAKGVSLVAVRVSDCDGGALTSTVISGLDWIRGNHPQNSIVNMSLSGDVSASLDNAINALVANGVPVIAAAGNNTNDGSDDACQTSPGRVGAATIVAATNITDSRASFTKGGPCVDINAPGDNILSAHNSSDVATKTRSGSSMATPHVTGVAAIYLQQNPGTAPSTLELALRSSASASVLTGLVPGTPNLMLYTGGGAGGIANTKAPQVFIDNPVNNFVATVGSFQIITRARSGTGISTMTLKMDGSPFISCAGSQGPETTCISFYLGAQLSPGTHTLTVEATDKSLFPKTGTKSISIIKN